MSFGVVFIALITRIRWLGLLALYFMVQWWIFALPRWSMGFYIILMAWMGWVLVSQRVCERGVRLVNWAFVLSGIVHVVFMLLQVAEIDPIMKPITALGVLDLDMKQPIVGLFSNPSDVGLFLALCLPLVLMLNHPSDVAIFSLFGLGIYLSKSTTAVGVAFLVILLYMIQSYRKYKISAGWLFGLLPLVALSGIWFTKIDHISHNFLRFKIWKQAFAVWSRSPWIGWGAGAVGQKWTFMQRPNSLWTMLQNEWLELLFNHGVIGLAIVLLCVIWTIHRCVKYKVDYWIWIGLVAVGSAACISIPFHLMPTAVLAAWYIGQAWGKRYGPEKA
jgi:hypothetical protein